jgi:integrase
MDTSYDVRVFAKIRERARRRPFEVRWKVAGQPHSESFRTRPLADGFRARLVKATHDGEPFDVATGRPAAWVREEERKRLDVTWLGFARTYAAMKWPDAAAKQRASIADSLATVTAALVTSTTGMPDVKTRRKALYGWAFNPSRDLAAAPPEVTEALAWFERNSLKVSDVDDPAVMRRVLAAIATKLDGKPAAANTIRRKRPVFSNALSYAVELKLLRSNPLHGIRRPVPKSSDEVDPRTVAVNPTQVRAILDAVAQQGKQRGPRMVAFFACLYYAAMRPAEAIDLTLTACTLPAEGWGQALLSNTAPRVGSAWTDSGEAHDRRGLKWRARGDVRVVPLPPQLVRILRQHIADFGTAPDGRIFQTLRGGRVQESGYGEVWHKARAAALPADADDTLAIRRPYDLRHAAVSLWLNSGVPATEVAARAGHSVDVLLRIYAKCISGQAGPANGQIAAALG